MGHGSNGSRFGWVTCWPMTHHYSAKPVRHNVTNTEVGFVKFVNRIFKHSVKADCRQLGRPPLLQWTVVIPVCFCVPCCTKLQLAYITVFKLRGYVVKPMGQGSCIMGHWSVFVWVSGSRVTVCDPTACSGLSEGTTQLRTEQLKYSSVSCFAHRCVINETVIY